MGTPETSTELRTGQLALWGASYHKQTRGNEETVRANLAVPIRSLSADGKAMPPPTTAKTWDSGCSLSHRKSVSFLLQCVQPVFSPVCSSCSHLSRCPAPPTHWLLFTTARFQLCPMSSDHFKPPLMLPYDRLCQTTSPCRVRRKLRKRVYIFLAFRDQRMNPQRCSQSYLLASCGTLSPYT